MDAIFDNFSSSLVGGEKTEQERIDSVLNHPFFMTSMKNDLEYTETIEAIQSLVFDGTPQEVAENFKTQGNACFAEGKRKFKDAIKFYTQGIEAKAPDNHLNSILHSNRAAVNLELNNFRSCLYDCSKAIQFNPNNIKAYYRSVKALLALDKVEEGLDCCQKGMLLDPTNPHFKADLKRLQERKEKLEELDRLSKIKSIAKQKKVEEFEAAKLSRNYRFFESPDSDDEDTQIPAQHPNADSYKIVLLPDGEFTFPVLFLYPEFNQSDIISAFKESDTFYSHFEIMFGEPSPWDPNHLYHAQTLDWYFETKVEKYSKVPQELVSCLKSVQVPSAPAQSAPHKYVMMTLKDVLQNPKHTIVNGVVQIIVLSRNSPEFSLKYRKEYKWLHQ